MTNLLKTLGRETKGFRLVSDADADLYDLRRSSWR